MPRLGGPPERNEAGEGHRMVGPLRAHEETRSVKEPSNGTSHAMTSQLTTSVRKLPGCCTGTTSWSNEHDMTAYWTTSLHGSWEQPTTTRSVNLFTGSNKVLHWTTWSNEHNITAHWDCQPGWELGTTHHHEAHEFIHG
ncbi:hypothetical protein B0H13DRAFT_2306955 [Mycena leptocephala]|nr:hypothetical protein B0H13DRAFT_2306955 [Mycena leptocephala]